MASQLDLSMFDDIEFEGLQKVSTKGKVDIVFVIDVSGSMTPVIEGVRDNVITFVDSLKDNANNKIDYRLGLVLENCHTFWIKNFTTSVDEFRSILENVDSTRSNEFTLPAIDVAADFDWDENRHKFIIIFTDEDIEDGCLPDIQLSKYDELIDKLNQRRIKIYYLGIHTDNWERLKEVKGTYYEPHEEYNSVDFSELFKRIGKSVSQASASALQQGNYSEKNIYNVEDYINIEYL